MIPPLLQPILRAADRRLRLQASVRLLLVTLSLGLLFTLLLSLVGRIYPLTWPTRLLALGLGLTAGGILITQLYAWLRPQSPLAAARQLDRRLRLDERLSTALELAQQPGHTPPALVQAQLDDTSVQLRRFDAARALPLPSPWRWLGVVCCLALALGANLFIPNPQLDLLQQQAETEAAIAEQKAGFEEVRAELLEDKPLLETPQGQELLQTLDELIKELEENKLNLEEAMAAISTAEQKLAQLRDSQEEQPATLNDLAQTFSQFESTNALAEALARRDLAKAAEALASAGQQAAANPEEAQNLANALRQAAQTAEAAGNSDLAGALNRAAEAVEQAAGQNGQNGTARMAEEALRQAADALAEAGQQQAGQEALEQALANIQEAREQLARTSGQGEAEAGQSQGVGRQTGPGQGTGGGSGREDPGPGAEGLTAEQGTSNEMSTDNGPNEGRTREYESLYAPSHLGGEGGPIVKPEEQGAAGGLPIGDAPVDPNQDPGAALVPYDQVYGEYAEAAGQAVDESYIPLGMKGYIRQYFGALEPERR